MGRKRKQIVSQTKPASPQPEQPVVLTPELLKATPQPHNIQFGVQVAMATRASPLPSPQDMAAFAAIDPLLPNRIMAMAEEQQQHIQSMQKDDLARITAGEAGEREIKKRSQNYGLLIVILLSSIGAWLTHKDHDWVGGGIFTTTIIGVAGIYVVGRLPGDGKKDAAKNSN